MAAVVSARDNYWIGGFTGSARETVVEIAALWLWLFRGSIYY